MLQKFWQSKKGNLIEVAIGIVLMGALSYGFWSTWNTNMTEAGDSIKAKVEADQWLD